MWNPPPVSCSDAFLKIHGRSSYIWLITTCQRRCKNVKFSRVYVGHSVQGRGSPFELSHGALDLILHLPPPLPPNQADIRLSLPVITHGNSHYHLVAITGDLFKLYRLWTPFWYWHLVAKARTVGKLPIHILLEYFPCSFLFLSNNLFHIFIACQTECGLFIKSIILSAILCS